MDSSSPALPPPRRLRRCAAALLALLLGGAAALLAWRAQVRTQLADLDRQLVLARDAGNSAAVGEIARRIVRLDSAPDRLLAVSESLLQARLFGDLEAALATAQRRAPQRSAAILRLRARAEAARPDFAASLALWDEYLATPALAAADRATALDAVAALLATQGRWADALARLDTRLALADAAPARLLRAQAAVRLHRWTAAQQDFKHLRTHAAAEPSVRDRLPAWERIERSLAAVQAADTAVDSATPQDIQELLRRALLCTRLGLWQNAAADLRTVGAIAPAALSPRLLGNALGLPAPFPKPQPGAAVDPLGQVDWLAGSTQLAALLDRLDASWMLWHKLAGLDARIAASADVPAELRAERAGIVCTLGFPEPALAEAQALRSGAPAFLPARRILVQALLASGEIAQAANETAEALALPGATEDTALRLLAGLVWQAQGNHAAAVDALTLCIDAAQPADPALLHARARSLRQLQRFSEAAADTTEAERLEAASAREGGAQ
jgi:hypothetical protein